MIFVEFFQIKEISKNSKKSKIDPTTITYYLEILASIIYNKIYFLFFSGWQAIVYWSSRQLVLAGYVKIHFLFKTHLYISTNNYFQKYIFLCVHFLCKLGVPRRIKLCFRTNVFYRRSCPFPICSTKTGR